MHNLVRTNLKMGSSKIQDFKEIIQESVYPDNPEYFSPGAMASAVRIIEKLKNNVAMSAHELIDLQLFYVECGTQFTCDYGDIDEDFYMELEEAFEEVVQLIKQQKALPIFQNRLYSIWKSTQNIGWGYHDQIEAILNENFPGLIDKKI